MLCKLSVHVYTYTIVYTFFNILKMELKHTVHQLKITI